MSCADTLSKTDKFNFGLEMSTAIKGIAICIMIFHHFFAFPGWIEDNIVFYGIPLAGHTLEYYVAAAGKICVAMYTLLSGYGLYISFSKKRTVWDYRYILKKTVQLLINWYLILFIVQIPIMMICDNWVGVEDLIGYMTITSLHNNPFVGYLKFYLCALWTFPLWFLIISKCRWNKILAIVLPFAGIALRKLVVHFLGDSGLLYTYILYMPYMITGMLICKEKWFEKAYLKIKCFKLYKVAALLCIVAVVAVRTILDGSALSFDCWLSAILIFCIAVLLQNAYKTKKIFAKLGKYSTNLWYTHAVLIFNGAAIQSVLYAPRVPVVILAWGILLCMPGVILVYSLQKCINFCVSKIMN